MSCLAAVYVLYCLEQLPHEEAHFSLFQRPIPHDILEEITSSHELEHDVRATGDVPSSIRKCVEHLLDVRMVVESRHHLNLRMFLLDD